MIRSEHVWYVSIKNQELQFEGRGLENKFGLMGTIKITNEAWGSEHPLAYTI